MIRVAIQGGTGNQMFQYAHARVLAEKYDQRLLLDLTHFKKRSASRPYALDQLGIDTPVSYKSASGFRRSLWKRLRPLNRWLMERQWPTVCDTYLLGFWQSEKFFHGRHALVKSLFSFPEGESKYSAQIEVSNSVAVHVRRGDYTQIANYQVCDKAYYERAMSLARQQLSMPKFFIFSDDPEWCQSHLASGADTEVVRECESDLAELSLMSRCKHTIISNSSFSWWGAWLNESQGKLVIAPDRWFVDERDNHEYMNQYEIIPSRWRKIECRVGQSG